MQRHICLASFDEAAAADRSCPLEQIADASGIAVGGSVLQMTRDLSRVKVLMTHSKSLRPAQQNWPPLIQEAFAQLEVKRATRRTFGSIRTVCWPDHANLTRAQTSVIGLDPKLVRWVGEILLDGSEIRSLSGRSATLGDSFSRNPKDRDRLLEARTRDLQGMSGRLRGFDLDYLEKGTEGSEPVPWAVGSDTVPDTADRGSVAVPVAVATEARRDQAREAFESLTTCAGKSPQTRLYVELQSPSSSVDWARRAGWLQPSSGGAWSWSSRSRPGTCSERRPAPLARPGRALRLSGFCGHVCGAPSAVIRRSRSLARSSRGSSPSLPSEASRWSEVWRQAMRSCALSDWIPL